MQITLFSEDSTRATKWYLFKNTTELGRIYDVIDWAGLTSLLPIKKTQVGAPAWLPTQGLFGLMFLKHYLGLSDEKLVERFNTDYALQCFCGTLLPDYERIKDKAFVSRIRTYLGQHVNLPLLQQVLVKQWNQADLSQTGVVMMDATVYESGIRFPTDVKLLWECCQWLWLRHIPDLCQRYRLRIPRSKIKPQHQKYLAYCKLRRKSYRKTKARRKALLHLLQKGIEAFQALLNQTQGGLLAAPVYSRFRTIRAIYRQQQRHYAYPAEKIRHRIVSIHKPYVRPIVRGKENKDVEFGAKVHMLQVDGINLIEHLSFENFNECKRLKKSVVKHEKCFGFCTHLAADRIYPTNENRVFIRARNIQTNFVNKGPKQDDKPTRQLKGLLNRQRNASVEGSFGNEKNHYLLRKVNARTQPTEQVWIYFGVMTANAVKLAKRRSRQGQDELLRQAA